MYFPFVRRTAPKCRGRPLIPAGFCRRGAAHQTIVNDVCHFRARVFFCPNHLPTLTIPTSQPPWHTPHMCYVRRSGHRLQLDAFQFTTSSPRRSSPQAPRDAAYRPHRPATPMSRTVPLLPPPTTLQPPRTHPRITAKAMANASPSRKPKKTSSPRPSA